MKLLPSLPPRLKQGLRLLAPGIFAAEVRRVLGKLGRRCRRIEARVVRLKSGGAGRGRALFSYILDPLCRPPGTPPAHHHTHDWESLTMVRTLRDLGFAVDAIHWTNGRFRPREDYELFVDVRLNMERIGPLVGPACLKVLHIETAHWRFHNAAQMRRLEELRRRRGIELSPHRLIEENRAIEHADCATILGNEFTAGTYAFAGKPMFRVPISTPFLYPFPEDKDFAACRRGFLWFGSGGLVHKGLDLVLEAFAGMPDYRLTVCGPVRRERDFEAAFWRQLYETPNIRTVGWVDVGAPAFLRIARSCAGVVYPSCSEGGGGSVVTCMHAGLVPVVSYEASVDVDPSFGLLLEECSVAGIRKAVRGLAELPPDRLREMAEGAWGFARDRHTRDRFAREYARAIRGILGTAAARRSGAEGSGA